LSDSESAGAPAPVRREFATDSAEPAPSRAAGDRPLIGLTTYLEQSQTGVWDVPAAFLPEVYFDAVTRAGGIAVLLPPQPVDAGVATRILLALDGLIVTGGKDVDPARYGASRHPETDDPRLDRDAWEDALLTAAIELKLPFLGICRGAQMLNVALGGSLVQHLPDVVGSHRYSPGNGQFADNAVVVEHDSRLSGLVGGGLLGKSYHHQAIAALGNGLAVTARSDDGTVQAVELAGHPFGLAVQWHPEQDPDDLRLFAGLVDAATRYHRESHDASDLRAAS